MAFRNFSIEEALSSHFNTYLMQQMVITCTASTRPSSPVSGMRIWQTDTDTEYVYDGSAWRLLSAINPFVLKPADETIDNTSTLQNDDHLLVSVSANVTYLVELFIISDTHPTADLKIGWYGPSGATLIWSSQAPHTSSPGTIDARTISVNAIGTIGGAADLAEAGCAIARGLLQVSSVAGTFGFRWAQAVATVTTFGTTIKTDSYLALTAVA